MKMNVLRAVAITLGMSTCVVAHADSNYTSPSKWNNFYPVAHQDKAGKAAEAVKEVAKEATKEKAMKAADKVEQLPAGNATTVAPQPTPMHSAPMTNSAPMMHSSPMVSNVPCAPCQQAMPITQAVQMNRPSLMPYFGSANLLFLDLANGGNRYVASGLGSDFNTSLVDPTDSVGFDIQMGRYTNCNRFGIGVGYFLWNPGIESVTRIGTAGTIRATSPAYRDISVDAGSGVEPIYDIIDGSGAYTGATGVRMTRDLRFQGIEANLYSFGLMGAARAARRQGGPCGPFGLICGGAGGAGGPLVRARDGRVSVMTSHGFRWFQVEDELELAYNIDGTAGYQAADLYENVDVENNLFGYQFGGRLSYCLNNRTTLNIGGKFGLYGNRAEVRHRVGTQTALAYLNGSATDVIDTEDSDTVLATLGELDLGLGYRFSNCWTVRGGYRLMGLTGVATAVDSLPTNYSSVANSGRVDANDSYVIHGGYVGLEFNW